MSAPRRSPASPGPLLLSLLLLCVEARSDHSAAPAGQPAGIAGAEGWRSSSDCERRWLRACAAICATACGSGSARPPPPPLLLPLPCPDAPLPECTPPPRLAPPLALLRPWPPCAIE
jgi:hypothetical protein